MKIAAVLFTVVLAAIPASAQKLDLKFDALAARASDKAEVDLDGATLQTLLQVAAKSGKDSKELKGLPELLGGIQEVHVRHYEFEKPGAWSDKDLEGLRQQVSGAAGWTRIASVKEKDEATEVYVLSQGGKLGGALIMTGEAKELTVVHVLGVLTLAQMKELVDSKIAYNLGNVDLLGALAK